MSQLILPGTAGVGDVRAGKGFCAGTNYGVSGTLDLSLLVTGNLKSGITIDGVSGKTSVVDTSDANAIAGQILSGLYAYVNGVKLMGTMPYVGAVTLTASGTGAVTIPAGYHNGAGIVSQVSVTAAHVLAGDTVAGVAGAMPNQGSPTLSPGTSITAGYYSGGNVASVPHGSQLYTTPGSYTFIVPSNVTQLTGVAIGGGAGGPGGNYCAESGFCDCSTSVVIPGSSVTIVVGTAGGAYGGNSSAYNAGGINLSASGGQFSNWATGNIPTLSKILGVSYGQGGYGSSPGAPGAVCLFW